MTDASAGPRFPLCLRLNVMLGRREEGRRGRKEGEGGRNEGGMREEERREGGRKEGGRRGREEKEGGRREGRHHLEVSL